MAGDVWDERTVYEHIVRDVPGMEVPNVMAWMVAQNYGIEQTDGSYESEKSFLDQLHTVKGLSHLDIIENLRDLAQMIDSNRDERKFGKARV